jgi:hypothetical protein
MCKSNISELIQVPYLKFQYGTGARVVMRTISDGWTDRRTDGRTMAAGASVTWTHCSILFEVTWDKTLASARTWCDRADMDVRADAFLHPRGRTSLPTLSARTQK